MDNKYHKNQSCFNERPKVQSIIDNSDTQMTNVKMSSKVSRTYDLRYSKARNDNIKKAKIVEINFDKFQELIQSNNLDLNPKTIKEVQSLVSVDDLVNNSTKAPGDVLASCIIDK